MLYLVLQGFTKGVEGCAEGIAFGTTFGATCTQANNKVTKYFTFGKHVDEKITENCSAIFVSSLHEIEGDGVLKATPPVL